MATADSGLGPRTIDDGRVRTRTPRTSLGTQAAVVDLARRGPRLTVLWDPSRPVEGGVEIAACDERGNALPVEHDGAESGADREVLLLSPGTASVTVRGPGGAESRAGSVRLDLEPPLGPDSRSPEGLAGGLVLDAVEFEGPWLQCAVRLLNHGSARWLARSGDEVRGGVAVGVRGRLPDGELEDLARFPLRRDLVAGGADRMDFAMRVPSGVASLRFDLVSEGVCWLTEHLGALELPVGGIRRRVPEADTDPLATVGLKLLDHRVSSAGLRLRLEVTNPGSVPLRGEDEGPDLGKLRIGVEARVAADGASVFEERILLPPEVGPGESVEVERELVLPSEAKLVILRLVSEGIYASQRRTIRLELPGSGMSSRGTPWGLAGAIRLEEVHRDRTGVSGVAVLFNRGSVSWQGPRVAPSEPRGSVALRVTAVAGGGSRNEVARIPVERTVAPGRSARLRFGFRLAPEVVVLDLELIAESVGAFPIRRSIPVPISSSSPARGGAGSRKGLRAGWRAVRGWLRPLAPVVLELKCLATRCRLFTGSRWRRLTGRDRPVTPTLPPPAGVPTPLPRVLVVSPYPIYPVDHGGAARIFNLLRTMSESAELHLLVTSLEPEPPGAREALGRYCRHYEHLHLHGRFGGGRTRLLPPSARLFASGRTAARIGELVSRFRIEVVQLEYAELAQYGPGIRSAKVVLVAEDLAFRSLDRRLRLDFARRFPESRAFGSSRHEWRQQVAYELDGYSRADAIHVMSEADRDALLRYLPDLSSRIRVVPNASETTSAAGSAPTPRDRDVLLFGNYDNLPNRDALEHFVEEIWPLVRVLSPAARLTIAGARLPQKYRELDGVQGIHVAGYVSDPARLYGSHRVLAVPLRAGSGTRLKILEAFGAGTAVVSTAIGAEGLGCEDGRELLLAESPKEIAEAVCRLLADDRLVHRLTSAARAWIEDGQTWTEAARLNLESIRTLCRPHPSALLEGVRSLAPREAAAGDPEISVVIPTRGGGPILARVLEAIGRQRCPRSFEVLCVDSGSPEVEIEGMRERGACVLRVAPESFDHGATRDFGAASSRGSVLVFLNQDAEPVDDRWLERLTAPLFEPDAPAAVQGGIREPDSGGFFWGTNGPRYYFTRESREWSDRHYGVGFSTVNAAISRRAWEVLPFGEAPFMEDKIWQHRARLLGWRIAAAEEAAVRHGHRHRWRVSCRRILLEGKAWRALGERYGPGAALADLIRADLWRELGRGMKRGEVSAVLEVAYPVLRPVLLACGNLLGRRRAP